jgi:hypothetical protein
MYFFLYSFHFSYILFKNALLYFRLFLQSKVQKLPWTEKMATLRHLVQFIAVFIHAFKAEIMCPTLYTVITDLTT